MEVSSMILFLQIVSAFCAGYFLMKALINLCGLKNATLLWLGFSLIIIACALPSFAQDADSSNPSTATIDSGTETLIVTDYEE